MRVEFLRLKQFRNYHDESINFNSQVNVILGQNGQGKSNLIEAVHIVLSGESFRPNEKEDLIQIGSEQEVAKLTATISQREIKKESEVILTKSSKQVTLNNKKASSSELKKRFSTVVFTPDSLSVVKQGPNERRLFVDGILTSINRESVAIINDYTRCLKTKNRVMRSVLSGELDRQEALKITASLEPQFLSLATKVTLFRIEMLKTVILRVKKGLKYLLNNQDVDISVDYVISQQSAIDWSQNQVYDAMKSRLWDLREAEWSAGQSLVGPHRHDIQINLNGHNLRYYGSQGQQRAVVLSFKLAQIMHHYEVHGEYPVLLLDDVFSELDFEKRANLLAQLSDMPAQIFLTTTEIESQNDFGNRDRKVFVVEKGKVSSGWK